LSTGIAAVDVLLVTFLASMAVKDYREGRVDSVSVLLFLASGAAFAVLQGQAQRGVLALGVALCGVLQVKLWRLNWGALPVGWADWLIVAALAFFLPARDFSMMLFVASAFLVLGMAAGYMFKKEAFGIRAVPVFFAATVFALVMKL
jgi:hypothetical protein